MIASEGSVGRVFVLRLEDGDRLPECIERFATERGVSRGLCALIGGLGGGRLVVGPQQSDASPITPLVHAVEGVHEAAALGTLFPDAGGTPRLHMHAALGREGRTRTGCIRQGVDVWKLGEVVVLEILGTGMGRRPDAETGFEVLVPDPQA